MKKPSVLRAVAATAATLVLLSGCGGGGGGSSGGASPPSVSQFGASTSFEGVCTVDGQKQFVRSYLDEVYLWYNEIPTVDASVFTSIPDYFRALLVKTPDANGLPKDRFSAVLLTTQVQSSLITGSGSASQADVTTLVSANTQAVPVTKVVTSSTGRRAGYILFLDHAQGAQDALINSFRQLKNENVQDLVLDLRFNSGGFLYIALGAASMVAGPSAEHRTFEQLRYNDKRSTESAASRLAFSSTVQFGETDYPQGTPLPQLGLPRLYVLVSGQTCSSSESIVNSLRGIDVEVVLIGQTTCGKPYGFRRKDNCGYTFFPIEFQGTNAKGFGDYTTGFRPTCTVADSPSASAGGARDPLLAAALTHIDTGSCPAGTATTGLFASGDPQATPVPGPARPAWAGRLLLPKQ